MRPIAKKATRWLLAGRRCGDWDRAVVIGPYGSGKSIFMKCISGLWRCRPHSYGRWFYVSPEPQVPKRIRARDYIEILESALGIKAQLELMDVNYF